jgi:hypothetical protein
MSEQRIDTGADASIRADADPGEGQGLSTPGAHPGTVTSGATGDVGDATVPHDERAGADESPDGDTEGERSVRAAKAAREQQEPERS